MTLAIEGAVGTAFGSGATARTLTIPGTPVAGDWICCHYTCATGGITNAQFEMEGGTGDVLTNLVASYAGLDTSFYVAFRQLSAADVADGTVQIRRTNDGAIHLGVFQIATISTTEGIASITAHSVNNGSGTSILATGYDGAEAAAIGDWVFGIYGTDPNNPAVDFTDPAGWTRVLETNGNIRPGGLIIRRDVTATGAQAGATATITSSENYQAVQILIKETAAGGTTHAGSGSSVATSSSSGTATVTRAASGAVTDSSSSSGSASIAQAASGSSTATSSSSADTTVTLAASGASTATSSSSGNADVGGTVTASGSSTATSTSSGAATATLAAAGSSTATSWSTGAASAHQQASGSSTATSASSGNASTSTAQAASGSSTATSTSSGRATIRQAASGASTATPSSTGRASVRLIASGTAVASTVSTSAAGVDIKVAGASVATSASSGNARIPGQSPIITGDLTVTLLDDGRRTATLLDDGRRTATIT